MSSSYVLQIRVPTGNIFFCQYLTVPRGERHDGMSIDLELAADTIKAPTCVIRWERKFESGNFNYPQSTQVHGWVNRVCFDSF